MSCGLSNACYEGIAAGKLRKLKIANYINNEYENLTAIEDDVRSCVNYVLQIRGQVSH